MLPRVPRRRVAGTVAALAALLLVGSAAGHGSATRGAPPPAPSPPPSSLGTQGGGSSGPELQVRWRAPEGTRELVRTLEEDGWWRAPLPGIGPPARVLGTDPIHVWLVEDLRDVLPGGGDAARDWVAGIAQAERRRIVVELSSGRRGPRALATLLRHELAHLALSAATGGRAPRWLHEGYAQYAAGSWGADRAWKVRLALFRGEGGALQSLSLGFPRDEQGAELAYLLSYTAVHELASFSGERGLAAFFSRLAAGAGVDGALRDVYGLTLDQFEDRWRESVADRYGWLYLLSRASVFWGAVSVLILFVYWKRRRRDRERMEALRAQEWWTSEEPPRPGAAEGADGVDAEGERF